MKRRPEVYRVMVGGQAVARRKRIANASAIAEQARRRQGDGLLRLFAPVRVESERRPIPPRRRLMLADVERAMVGLWEAVGP